MNEAAAEWWQPNFSYPAHCTGSLLLLLFPERTFDSNHNSFHEIAIFLQISTTLSAIINVLDRSSLYLGIQMTSTHSIVRRQYGVPLQDKMAEGTVRMVHH